MTEQRRLATILAMDVAGYSRAAERDDSEAASSVRKLRALITKVAEAAGGRIFNSAGDGFMLEFATATEGLQAAVTLLEEAKSKDQSVPRARMGLHLGEVIVEPDGDLLGHGVNIAARPQQMAAPGGLIVSEDVRRSVRGELAHLLVPKGEVTLDKMSEKMSVFAYARSAGPRPLHWLRSSRFRWATIVLAAVAAIAGAFFFVEGMPPAQNQSSAPSVAVLPFASLSGSREDEVFAQSLTRSIASAMTDAGLSVSSQTVSADVGRDTDARALNVLYLIGGEVTREGNLVRVSVRVDDAREARTVFTESFERPGAQVAELPREIAARLAAQAWILTASAATGASAAVTSSMSRASELEERGDYMAAYQVALAAAREHPRSAQAQTNLAWHGGNAYRAAPIEDVAEIVRTSRAATRRARQLSPNFGDAYFTDIRLRPRFLWAEAEIDLREALRVDPDNSSVATFLAEILIKEGRIREAASFAAAAADHDPFNRIKTNRHYYTLTLLGEDRRAAEMLARTERLTPGAIDFIGAQFVAASAVGSPSALELLMRDSATAEIIDPPRGSRSVHLVLRALSTRTQGDIEAALRACPQGPFSQEQILYEEAQIATCLTGLILLDRLDDAFAYATHAYPQQRSTPREEERAFLSRSAPPFLDTIYLYRRDAVAFRADIRFEALARRIGLLDAWRASGRAPDFCAAERAPVCAAIG